MTDEQINVVYDVTQKGMERVKSLVSDIRKELNDAGTDTSTLERRFDSLERTVQDVTSQVRSLGQAGKAATAETTAGANKTRTAFGKIKKEIAAANAEYRKFAKGQVTGEGGGKSLGDFSEKKLKKWSAAQKADNADLVRDYEAAERKKVQAKTRAEREQAKIEAEQNRIYLSYMEHQYAAEKKAADVAIREAQRVANEKKKLYDQQTRDIDAGLATANRGVAAGTKALPSRGGRGVENAAAMKEWDAAFKSATVSANAYGEAQGNIIAQRYALYDIASTVGIIGAAMAGAAIYAGVVGARFEAAFTNVERTLATDTTAAQVDGIRESLVRLSGQIPLTFDQLAQIATIGNQMGIAEDEIIDFTGTIARFASVSGMSIESVTKAFGGFAAQTGLDPKYFENLGASIAKVGIDSNATEEQIVALIRELATGASGAGFAADAIVGLSGTLAGLQVPPERARGALDTYFNTLAMAVAEGGDKLEKFASVVGVTASELDRMVRNDEGAEVMRRFIETLNASPDDVELIQTLDELGLAQLRVGNTFKRLSGDLSIFDRDQKNANEAFMEGAELQRQYAMTVDDLASQWVIFINNLNAVVDAVSGGAIPSIALLFTGINNVLMALTQWLGDNKWAAMLLAFGTAVVGALGVILLFRAASMTATAALLAFRIMAQQAGGAALVASGGIRGLIGTLVGVQGAAAGAAGGLFTLRSAIRAVLASTGIGLLVVLGGGLIEMLMGQDTAANDAALSMEEYNDAVGKLGSGTEEAASESENLADQLGGGGGVGDAAEEAAVKVRTLVDYVNDLTGVFQRSSAIRFGSAAAMDEITLKWIELNEEAQKYQQTIRSLTADRELQAYWLSIAELYDDQLRAGQIREDIAKIDDEMAEAQKGASRELNGNSRAAIENRKTMRGLLGSYEEYVTALAEAGASQEEIQAVLATLNGDFATQATALGFAGSELVTYQQRFGDLATIVGAMPRDITVGFNGDPALQALNEFFAQAAADAALAGANAGGGFSDGFGGALNEDLPLLLDETETGIEEGTVGWLERLQAFYDETFTEWGAFWASLGDGSWWEGVIASFDQTFATFGTNFETFKTSFTQGWSDFWSGLSSGRWWQGVMNGFADSWNRMITNLKDVTILGQKPFAGLPLMPVADRGRNGGGDFYTGGFTGRGHWQQPKGTVHAGEYVIPQKHVDQRTGLPDPNYVAQLSRGRSVTAGYAGGGMVGGGGFNGPMELGPATLHYIGQALQVRLGIGNRELARESARGDRQLAWAGSNGN